MLQPDNQSLRTVKEIRQTLGITQEEMAKRLGITRNYLALMETEKRKTPIAVTEKANRIVTDSNIHAHGATVNGGIIGHNGTVTTIQQETLDFRAEIRERLTALETDLSLIKKLLAQQP